jgi:glycosyltransferase involved in cell wall biosynthesis
VVDLCDATSSRLQGEARHARPLRRADLRLQQIAMRRIERALIARGQQLLVATERDRDLLLGPAAGSPAGPGEGADRAVVVPNGVDVDRWSRSSPTLGSAVAFCGNLAYPPNEDAARQLVDEVMPQVWAHRPDTEVLLVGRGASTSLREAVRDPRVTVTGFVPDVRPLLERAAVFVAPLRFGAGIQNKLLEAMAMEIPVVTSALAADGLRTGGDEPPVGIADDPAAMAALVVARLDDATADPTPDRRGRSWVGERFAWDRSAAGLRAAIARAVAGEPRPC